MIITEGNFLQVAMNSYDNSSMNTIEELTQDLSRIALMERQFRRYKKSGDPNIRLLINHFICFTNVFGPMNVKLLKFKIVEEYHKQLNSVLFMFDYLDTHEEMDEELVILINKEIK
jgi:hypothetical protein